MQKKIKSLDDNELAKDLVLKLRQIKAKISLLDEEKQSLREELFSLCAGEDADCAGAKIRFIPTVLRDYKGYIKDNNIILEGKYLKSVLRTYIKAL